MSALNRSTLEYISLQYSIYFFVYLQTLMSVWVHLACMVHVLTKSTRINATVSQGLHEQGQYVSLESIHIRVHFIKIQYVLFRLSPDIDECLSSPCLHGTCVDQINSFQCICQSGFTGIHCETGKVFTTVWQ